MVNLFDSHAHLDDDKFDSDRDETIKKIKDNMIHHFTSMYLWK